VGALLTGVGALVDRLAVLIDLGLTVGALAAASGDDDVSLTAAAASEGAVYAVGTGDDLVGGEHGGSPALVYAGGVRV